MASTFSKAERRKGLREAPEKFEQLRQKWPKAFPAKSHEVRPLAKETAKTVATEFGWNYQYARAVLERWKLRNAYCCAVLTYQKRYTLDGLESDEPVDERAKTRAREMIENRQARRQQQALKEQSSGKTAPSPTPVTKNFRELVKLRMSNEAAFAEAIEREG